MNPTVTILIVIATFFLTNFVSKKIAKLTNGDAQMGISVVYALLCIFLSIFFSHFIVELFKTGDEYLFSVIQLMIHAIIGGLNSPWIFEKKSV